MHAALWTFVLVVGASPRVENPLPRAGVVESVIGELPCGPFGAPHEGPRCCDCNVPGAVDGVCAKGRLRRSLPTYHGPYYRRPFDDRREMNYPWSGPRWRPINPDFDRGPVIIKERPILLAPPVPRSQPVR